MVISLCHPLGFLNLSISNFTAITRFFYWLNLIETLQTCLSDRSNGLETTSFYVHGHPTFEQRPIFSTTSRDLRLILKTTRTFQLSKPIQIANQYLNDNNDSFNVCIQCSTSISCSARLATRRRLPNSIGSKTVKSKYPDKIAR